MLELASVAPLREGILRASPPVGPPQALRALASVEVLRRGTRIRRDSRVGPHGSCMGVILKMGSHCQADVASAILLLDTSRFMHAGLV